MQRATLILCALCAPLFADIESDVEQYIAEADETVITATGVETETRNAPYATNTISERRLRRHSYRTTPQIMRDTPGVFVQETSPGQGSPFMRGFTGFRTLLLIDGIRLNNSVFRDGPNQYWSTVDSYSVDRMEVVLGPSSVLYGSDAIGGTVQAFTRTPFTYGEGWQSGGRFVGRFASGENSYIGRGEVSVTRHDRTGFLGGLTYKQFGSIEAGSPMGTQPNTGFDEWDGDAKVEHFFDPNTRFVLAYQQVQQNNVPRTHRTTAAKSFHGTDLGDELRRDLDQERWLVYAQIHKEKMEGPIDAVHASLSYHAQSEVRDRLRTGDRRDMQGFDVGTIGFWAAVESQASFGRFTSGIEVYHDEVRSFSTGNPIQGPVGDDASYDLASAYTQGVIPLGDRFEIIAGARVTYAAASADSVRDPETDAQIAVSDNWTALVGSVRVLYHLVPDRWNLYAGASQGFRAPNLSDLTRFDSARSNEFEIPAPDLDPEDFYSFEFGAKGANEAHVVRFATFYTLIRDQIVRVPTGAMNGDGDLLITKDNVGDGYIMGAELFASWRVHPDWMIFGQVAYQYGKVDTFPTSDPVIVREYVDRLMPLTGQVGVRWDSSDDRFWAEVVVILVDRADRLSTRDQGDMQRIPPGGTPGYGILNLRGGWNIDRKTQLSVGVENVLDKSYRVHGSGSNMPGLNAIVTFSKEF